MLKFRAQKKKAKKKQVPGSREAGMCMRQVACERPYERDMHKADKRRRPGLSDVARQGEAVSRASTHDVRPARV